jgi:hypothetical protein
MPSALGMPTKKNANRMTREHRKARPRLPSQPLHQNLHLALRRNKPLGRPRGKSRDTAGRSLRRAPLMFISGTSARFPSSAQVTPIEGPFCFTQILKGERNDEPSFVTRRAVGQDYRGDGYRGFLEHQCGGHDGWSDHPRHCCFDYNQHTGRSRSRPRLGPRSWSRLGPWSWSWSRLGTWSRLAWSRMGLVRSVVVASAHRHLVLVHRADKEGLAAASASVEAHGARFGGRPFLRYDRSP